MCDECKPDIADVLDSMPKKCTVSVTNRKTGGTLRFDLGEVAHEARDHISELRHNLRAAALKHVRLEKRIYLYRCILGATLGMIAGLIIIHS